ncbi:MAG: hypothetical protein HY720_29150, partial [Planctomycetes bacterium]|nr:hypothetical protein [Planctomycetota bacterium]
MAFDDELKAAVEKFLEQNQVGGRLVETDAALAKPIADLDRLWWKRIELLLEERVRDNPEQLVFPEEGRLLMDCGLLSDSLLRDEAPRLRTDLFKELYAAGEKRFYYLSEWISDRLKNHIALEGLQETTAQIQEAVEVIETPVQVRLREARSKLYMAMGPFFENLPGFSPQAIVLLSSGRLDETLSRFRGEVPPDQASQRDRLLDLRTSILSRARSRCTVPAQLEMFDLLGQVDERMSAEDRLVAAPSLLVQEGTREPGIADRRRDFLV